MKFKYEHITPNPETVYKKEKKLEKECIALWKEKEYSHPKKHQTVPICPTENKVFERNHSFEWELFQWADSDFVHWVNEQPPTMVLAVMANMKQAPRLSPELEKWREKVDTVPFCSLEEYAKKKRLGERSVHFLKEMKKRYGQSILRLFYLTSD
jgi:predicted GNAT family acetyltransferase